MALNFGKQKSVDSPEWDLSALSGIGGLIGGAWDKLSSGQYKLDDPSSLEGSDMDEEEYMALVKQRQAGYEDTDPDFSGDRLSGTSEQFDAEPKTSIAQNLLSMVGGAWNSITDRGATVQDYFADYKRAKPDPARFGGWRKKPSGELPDYLKTNTPPDEYSFPAVDWNRKNRPAGVLTSPFMSKIWGK